ncbi:MAG: aldehyde dehydrogenase family protein [Hymenobacter sp.]
MAPVKGQYFDNPSPIDGKAFCKVARSTKEDIELALDAAHDAFKTWSKASPAARSNVLLKIADIMEANLAHLAAVETVENGKAIRETMAADLPLAIDHFRYFAGVIRAEEGSATELNENTLVARDSGAAGRGRPDYPLELPAADGHLETGARPWPPAAAWW